MSSGEKPFRLSNRLGLRPAEVADVLGISERSVRQVLPELPHLRIGTAVVVPVDALRDWLRRRAEEGPTRIGAIVNDVMSSLSNDED